MSGEVRIGIDLGGTKIAAIALGPSDVTLASLKQDTPRHDYKATLDAICALVERIEHETEAGASVGIGIPGSLSPASGNVQNANSTWLNGRPFAKDLEGLLGRPLRFANDANCFALSEALDGAGAGANSVFGVIIGTGCGGGLVINQSLIDGPMRIRGEWGHNPLPWAHSAETPGPLCWCGRRGCIETWVSGPALERDHAETTGVGLTARELATAAATGDASASASLERHQDRLARALAALVNILDPDVIVLGGGLSQLPHLYTTLPEVMAPHVFSETPAVVIRPPTFGPESGVRGAARLWDQAA